MASEQQMKDITERLKFIEAKLERVDRVDTRVRALEEAKVDFGDKVAKKIAELESSAHMHMGALNSVVEEARQEFTQLRADLLAIFQGADQKFKEIEANMAEGKRFAEVDSKRQGYVPRNMAYPEVFCHEVDKWRDWKTEITKYADGVHKGMKRCLEEAAVREEEFTFDVLIELVKTHGLQLEEKWKDLYRLLEHRTKGEARKVVAGVKEEHGFEAWRRLHKRFEAGRGSMIGGAMQ